MKVIEWCNQYSGFIIGVLTLLYVGTTVWLLLSNRKMHKQNSLIQKQSLKLALLERRLDVFTTVRRFISKVMGDSTCENEDLQQFLRNSREVELFFDDDVINYVKELYRKGLEIHRIVKLLEGNRKDRDKLLEEEEAVMDWFLEQLERSTIIFDKYINVKKLGL